jgi:hypothetical protein
MITDQVINICIRGKQNEVSDAKQSTRGYAALEELHGRCRNPQTRLLLVVVRGDILNDRMVVSHPENLLSVVGLFCFLRNSGISSIWDNYMMRAPAFFTLGLGRWSKRGFWRLSAGHMLEIVSVDSQRVTEDI